MIYCFKGISTGYPIMASDPVSDNIIRYLENNPQFTWSGAWGCERKQRFMLDLPPNRVVSKWVIVISIDGKTHVCEDMFDTESRVSTTVSWSSFSPRDFSTWYIRDAGQLFLVVVYERPVFEETMLIRARCLWSI